MIKKIYKRLLTLYGPQHWWPVISNNPEFEICIGAILTQNTSWRNVEKAINNLYTKNLLHPERILRIPLEELSMLIRSAGYYNQKAQRLKSFARLYIDNSKKLKNLDVMNARRLLLSIKGVGRETADSMLLYAFNKKIFPVDTYTSRLFYRLGLVSEDSKDKYYEDIRLMVEKELSNMNDLKEFHALIVMHGKSYCKKKPLCKTCPLQECRTKDLYI